MKFKFLKPAASVLVCSLIIASGECGKTDSEYEFNSQPLEIERTPGEIIKLFDGSNFDQWQMAITDGWVIDNGAMLCIGNGDIWTKEYFENFVLKCEFKMSRDCNSGIFIRTGNPKDPVQTGIEIQVIDSFGKEIPDKHDCGALYDLMEPVKNAVKPAGEWNHITITCNNNVLTVVLNDVNIINADIEKWDTARKNPDGTENKFNIPIKDFPRIGFIGFQDHGHPVWYRDVTVTIL
ncbi:DUF1080 domain-containing protein [Candidatus Latescibacterota bacterium]